MEGKDNLALGEHQSPNHENPEGERVLNAENCGDVREAVPCDVE